ncbi:MAG: ice-binding family protein, partial [Gemmatimonadaceae bacterium]
MKNRMRFGKYQNTRQARRKVVRDGPDKVKSTSDPARHKGDMKMKRTCPYLTSSVALAAFFWGIAPVSAQTAPPLGGAQSFAVLAGSTVTNTGPTVVTGDVGVSPGSAVTGFPPGVVVGGAIHSNDTAAIAAQNSLTFAFNTLSAEPCTQDLTGQDLGGQILTAGVYCFNSSAGLTGTLTLDAQGNPNAV